LVGLYLTFLFEQKSLLWNGIWLAVMLVTANFTTLKRAKMVRRKFFFRTLAVTSFASLLTVTLLLAVVSGSVRHSLFYDARYLIPLMGMLLGNSMAANVISLETFYRSLRERQKEFETMRLLGATVAEATQPFRVTALRAAMNPLIASMATMGIVSLPGMMTGQMLGGSPPMTAVAYQLAILVSIFSLSVVSATCNILASIPVAMDACGNLRHDVLLAQTSRR